MSRLDYCNSLLFGTPKSCTGRLQKLQNRAARLVTKTPIRVNITPVLKDLHCLPIEKRIEFKIACIVFNCIHGISPCYLKSLVNLYNPPRTLRSSSSVLLESTLTRTKFLERSFSHSAPRIWNSLSPTTRNTQNLSCFKKYLKTELFRKVYC